MSAAGSIRRVDGVPVRSRGVKRWLLGLLAVLLVSACDAPEPTPPVRSIVPESPPVPAPPALPAEGVAAERLRDEQALKKPKPQKNEAATPEPAMLDLSVPEGWGGEWGISPARKGETGLLPPLFNRPAPPSSYELGGRLISDERQEAIEGAEISIRIVH